MKMTARTRVLIGCLLSALIGLAFGYLPVGWERLALYVVFMMVLLWTGWGVGERK